jgi:thiol-disulfide isomerase/thioredoxin
MRKVLFLLFTYSLLTLHTFGQEKMQSIKIRDLDGKEVDLQEIANNGKVTVISFWATWCSPCKKEIENIKDVMEKWEKDYNVQLVTISTDDSRNAMKVKPYVKAKNWNFINLIDVNQDTKRVLNWPNVPYTLLIDKTGTIVYKHVGYQEGDEFVLEDELKKLK